MSAGRGGGGAGEFTRHHHRNGQGEDSAGFGVHQELTDYTKCGLTAHEALIAATATNARLLGLDAIIRRAPVVAAPIGFAAGAYTESWVHMGDPTQNPMGVEWFGLAMGLGFVLSFGYWCTDFLVVQRAMAANSMAAARCCSVM